MDVRLINAGQRSVIITGHGFESWTQLTTNMPPHEELRLQAGTLECRIENLKKRQQRIMQAADILEGKP